MKREKKTIICSIIFIVIAGILYQFLKVPCKVEEEVLLNEITEVTEEPEILVEETYGVSDSPDRTYCYVCGAVESPGVYEFAEGARVDEMIALAGGFTKDAAVTYLNLADFVSDSEKIYVPTTEEVKSIPTEGLESTLTDNDQNSAEDKVNVNTADIDMLTTLPGIGEAKANSIVSYREEHGGFQSIEEIKNIEGIKDGIFNKIKDLITVQ